MWPAVWAGSDSGAATHLHMEAKFMRRNNLRDDYERTFPLGDTRRVVEIRYWSAADMATRVRLAATPWCAL